MKPVVVKYATLCHNCKHELPVGSNGYYDYSSRVMYCESCGSAEQPEITVKPSVQNVREESRSDAIARAHNENMMANKVLVEAILKLASEISWLPNAMRYPTMQRPPEGK